MLPGFKFLFGYGMVVGSGIAEACKVKPGQITEEEGRLLDIYHDIRYNIPVYPAGSGWRDPWYAPKIWPKYIYKNEYIPTAWIDLAHYYGSSVAALQEEYFQWYCKENNIRFDKRLFDYAYLRAHNPGAAAIDGQIQPKWSYNKELDRELRAKDEDEKRKKDEAKRAAEATQAEIDAEIIKRRIAAKEARLAREAIEAQAQRIYEEQTPRWKRNLAASLESFQTYLEERKYHRP